MDGRVLTLRDVKYEGETNVGVGHGHGQDGGSLASDVQIMYYECR